MKATYHIPYIKTEVGAPIAPALPQPEWIEDREALTLTWAPIQYADRYKYQTSSMTYYVASETPVTFDIPCHNHSTWTADCYAESGALETSAISHYEYPAPVQDMAKVINLYYDDSQHILYWTTVADKAIYEVSFIKDNVAKQVIRTQENILTVLDISEYDRIQIYGAKWGHWNYNTFDLPLGGDN